MMGKCIKKTLSDNATVYKNAVTLVKRALKCKLTEVTDKTFFQESKMYTEFVQSTLVTGWIRIGLL